MRHIPKPETGEYDPYAIMYIKLLPDDGNLLQHFEDNLKRAEELARSFSEQALTTAHQAGEWTIKEILLHIIDDERIYAYRALRAGRNDQTPLPGFEQEDYIAPSQANQRSIESILDEYRSVRMATISLFKYLPEEAFTHTTIANDHAVTVRALAYHIAGHELHHLNSIRENYS
ncbi:MAG: DinB family protein [Phototrophicaceae bacterium]